MHYTSASVKRMNDRKGKPWRGTLQYKDETGKWRQKTHVFHGARSKRDALAALDDWRRLMESEAERGPASSTARQPVAHARPITVAQGIREHLRRQYLFGFLSLGTYQKQVESAELNVFPFIGDIEFEKLTAKDMDRFIAALATTMKPSTIRNLYSIVNKTYRDAERRELVSANPCAKVSLPRVERSQINYLDAEGRARFLTEVALLPPDSPLRVGPLTALFTGMRASEVCALRWEDVDLDKMILHVKRSARRVKDERGGHVVAIGPTKTSSGNRTIPLLPQAASTLAKAAQCRSRIAKCDFVLGTDNDPALLCGSFQSWSKRRGIIGKAGKPASMHALRHTFATVSVQSGMDIKSLASILGHARADMTLNIYASDDEEAKRVAMRNLGALLEEQGLGAGGW